MKDINENKWLSVWVSNALRIGVILSVVLVCLGVIFSLIKDEYTFDFTKFFSSRRLVFSWSNWLSEFLSGNMISIIELGIFIMLLTPVVRIVFALIGFVREKDRLYVVLSLLVLTIMMLSFF